MKTSMTPREIKSAVCTVSTSILLCSTLEIQAAPPEDVTTPWYRGDIPVLSLLPPDPSRLAENLAAPAKPRFESQLLASVGTDSTAWEQIRGRQLGQGEVGNLGPQLSGAPGNFQVGPALYTAQSNSGNTQRAGLFVGQSQLPSDTVGFVATPGTDAFNLQGQSLGAYWSLTGAQGWHINLVAMGTRLNGQVRSEQGDWQATNGNAMTFSVEGGFPIGISENWVIEPQVQLINQRVSLISQSTSAASAPSDDLTSWSGRVGASLKGNYEVRGLPVEPYVHTNLWLTYSSGDTLTLGQVDKIASSRNSSTVEVGLGLLAKVSPTVSLFVSGDYSGSTDNAFGLIGNLGVRVRW